MWDDPMVWLTAGLVAATVGLVAATIGLVLFTKRLAQATSRLASSSERLETLQADHYRQAGPVLKVTQVLFERWEQKGKPNRPYWRAHIRFWVANVGRLPTTWGDARVEWMDPDGRHTLDLLDFAQEVESMALPPDGSTPGLDASFDVSNDGIEGPPTSGTYTLVVSSRGDREVRCNFDLPPPSLDNKAAGRRIVGPQRNAA
ncbi:MAG: hypothetical protein V4510_06530 [bacterium]